MDTCRVGTRLHNILMTAAELIVAGLLLFSPAAASEMKPDGSVECLALNMYHEARGQGSAGLLGVSSVVLNRVRDKRKANHQKSQDKSSHVTLPKLLNLFEPAATLSLRSVKLKKPPRAIIAQPPQIQLVKGFK